MTKYVYTLVCRNTICEHEETIVEVRKVESNSLETIWHNLIHYYEEHQLKEKIAACLLAVADGLIERIDNKKLEVVQGNRLDRIYRLGKAYHDLTTTSTIIDLDDTYEKTDPVAYYYKPVEDEDDEDYEYYNEDAERNKDKDCYDCESMEPMRKLKKSILTRLLYLTYTVISENESTRPDEMFELIKPVVKTDKDITLAMDKVN